MEAIAQAKSEYGAGSARAGTAVLNADDPRVLAMREHTSAGVMLYWARARGRRARENIVSRGLEGMEFDLLVAGQSVHVPLPMLGFHSIHAALCGAAVGLRAGFEHRGGGRRTAALLAITGLVVRPGVNGATVIDDTYNASRSPRWRA